MARETKVGLIVGLGVILFVSVFVSDYLSVPEAVEATGGDNLPNFVSSTTNQTEFVLRRDGETEASAPITDPRDLAVASLETAHRNAPPPDPPSVTIGTPPFRYGPTLARTLDDATPPAFDPDADPIGYEPIDDTQLARDNQLPPDRDGPGVNPLDHLMHVGLSEPQLINAQPQQIKHTVAAGETLTAIARKHYDGDGNMWRSIRDANPGKVGPNGEVVKGVVLIIPKRSTEADDPTVELGDTATAGSDRAQRRRVRMVTVKEGQTLSELAYEHLGSANKWQLIMDVNTDVLDNPRQLRAGMKLRIPAEPVVELIEEANEALSAENREIAAEHIERIETNTYTVKEGDSLYRIAADLLGDGERYHEIYKANKDKLSSATDIRPGMKLKLPER